MILEKYLKLQFPTFCQDVLLLFQFFVLGLENPSILDIAVVIEIIYDTSSYRYFFPDMLLTLIFRACCDNATLTLFL